MRLFALFVATSLLILLLQTTFLRLLPFGPIVPDLILVFCVYLGLNHPNAGSVLGSFLLGYFVDVFSSPILGPNAFAMSVVFLSVYLSSRCLWIHDALLGAAAVFFASWVKGLALVLVWSLFLTADHVWLGFLKYLFLEGLVAAVLAPGVFSLLKRGETYLAEAKRAL